jgi:DnaJ homologue, subfamily C, member 28, conserved domain
MPSSDTWIDRLIRQAQERGDFDNLPGKGKPLKFEDDALEDPDWRLANHLLKNAGFATEWIEADHDIRLALAEARRALLRSRRWRDEQLGQLGQRRDLPAEQQRDLVAGEWARAVGRFHEAVRAINKQIDSFNLKAPSLNMQRRRLDAAAEQQRLERGEET